MVQRSASPRRTAVAGVAVIVGLVVAGAVLVVVALVPRPATPPDDGVHAAGPAPTARSQRPVHGPEQVADRLRGPALAASPPVSLQVPRLHLDRPLVRLGVDPDGALAPPQRPEDIGWFTGSVTPGQVGPAVLAGHVTWNGVPAVFFRLGTMRPGDRVVVRRADRSSAAFEVTRVERYAKARFPTRRVYGATDHAALRLITCGGRYDAVHHRYADNVVVFADLVGRR